MKKRILKGLTNFLFLQERPVGHWPNIVSILLDKVHELNAMEKIVYFFDNVGLICKEFSNISFSALFLHNFFLLSLVCVGLIFSVSRAHTSWLEWTHAWLLLLYSTVKDQRRTLMLAHFWLVRKWIMRIGWSIYMHSEHSLLEKQPLTWIWLTQISCKYKPIAIYCPRLNCGTMLGEDFTRQFSW